MKKLFEQFLFFYKSKKVFSPPKKNSILIYDSISADKIKKALNNRQVNVLYTRGEQINVFIFFLSIIKSKGKISFQEYINFYLKYTDTRIVIVFLDINKKIIKLKKFNNKLKFISIQNGILSEKSLLNCKKNINFLEKIFLFSDSYKSFFSQEDQKKLVVHGSLLNNYFVLDNNKIDSSHRNIYYISQLREFYLTKKENFIRINDKILNTNDLFKAEEELLPYVVKFCANNNFKLHILGSLLEKVNLEIDYYSKLIGNKFKYHKRDFADFHYNVINNEEYFISIDSALGYEALSKLKKVSLFPIRGQFIKQNDRKFGWPLKFPENGEFWTNNANLSEFERILKHMVTIEKDKWEKLVLEKYKSVISYDKYNSKINNLISSIN